jgi:hypothetical protein
MKAVNESFQFIFLQNPQFGGTEKKYKRRVLGDFKNPKLLFIYLFIYFFLKKPPKQGYIRGFTSTQKTQSQS